MRDTFKTIGFRSLINERIKIIPKIIEGIKSNQVKSRKTSLRRFLLSRLLQKTIAHYSVGDDKQTVTQSLLQTIIAFENGFKFDDGYGDMDTMIWLVSLAILCDIDIEMFNKITAIIKRDNVQDKLLDFLIKSKDSEWQGNSSNYIQEHPYKSIDALLEETDNDIAVQKIKTYLDDKVWYKGHSDSYWHDSHKNKNVNLYFGYWAFEVAAIVKILGFNDEALQNQKYYPYDAVHW